MSSIIQQVLQNLPLRKPTDKVISSSRAGTELRGVIQKFRPFVDDVQAAIEDLNERVTDATSTTINMDLASLELPPDIQSEVHLHVQNLTVGNPNGGGSASPVRPPITVSWDVGATFWIDTVAGSDSNTGLTESSPVQTWGKLREIISAKRLPLTAAIKGKGTLQAPLDFSGFYGVADAVTLEFSGVGSTGADRLSVETPDNAYVSFAEGGEILKINFKYIDFHSKSCLIFSRYNADFETCKFISYATSTLAFVQFQDCDFKFLWGFGWESNPNNVIDATNQPLTPWGWTDLPFFLSNCSDGKIEGIQTIAFDRGGGVQDFPELFVVEEGLLTLSPNVFPEDEISFRGAPTGKISPSLQRLNLKVTISGSRVDPRPPHTFSWQSVSNGFLPIGYGYISDIDGLSISAATGSATFTLGYIPGNGNFTPVPFVDPISVDWDSNPYIGYLYPEFFYVPFGYEPGMPDDEVVWAIQVSASNNVTGLAATIEYK